MNEPEHQTDSPNPASMSEFATRSRQPSRGERQAGHWIQLIFASLIFVCGLMLSGKSVYQFLDKRQLAGWPQVSGKVFSSTIDGLDDFWMAEVEYEYAVDGVKYTNDAKEGGREGPCRRLVERYPQGSIVTVFYNRKSPHASVLEHSVEFDNSNYRSLGLHVAITVVGLIGAVTALVRLRRDRRTGAT